LCVFNVFGVFFCMLAYVGLCWTTTTTTTTTTTSTTTTVDGLFQIYVYICWVHAVNTYDRKSDFMYVDRLLMVSHVPMLTVVSIMIYRSHRLMESSVRRVCRISGTHVRASNRSELQGRRCVITWAGDELQSSPENNEHPMQSHTC
jgi:hypothetical protein